MELLVRRSGQHGQTPCAPHPGRGAVGGAGGRGFRPRAPEEARALGSEPYESIAAAVAARHFDAAFVCTAPLTHAGIIGEPAGRGPACIHRAEPGGRRLRRAHCKSSAEGPAAVFEQHYALPRRNAVHQAPVAAFAKPVNYIYHIGSICRTGTHGKIIKTFLLGDGARGACGRSSASICPGCWTLSVR